MQCDVHHNLLMNKHTCLCKVTAKATSTSTLFFTVKAPSPGGFEHEHEMLLALAGLMLITQRKYIFKSFHFGEINSIKRNNCYEKPKGFFKFFFDFF